MNNLVAIVGRPNVGKSSLFNKLVGKRKSIVHDEAGITRDRLYADIEWVGKKFQIIDTGGIEIENRPFQEQIKIQATIAMEEAAVIIFAVDGTEGLTLDDTFIINLLRKSNKKVIVAANKLEGNKEMDPSIWTIGLGNIYPISAIHGEGIGDLLDETVQALDLSDAPEEAFTKLTIIGRPNAGKSSLLNALASEERAIVSEIAGTTRDSVNSNLMINGKDFTVVDTAGINRKSKLVESVDHYALSRAMNSINEADIVLLVIDYERDIAHFDAVVAGYAFENNKPIITVVNKWDLAQKETMTMKRKEEEIRKNFKFLAWSPLIFISAKTGLRLDKLKEKVITVSENMRKYVKTSILNEVLTDIQLTQPAQSNNGGRLTIKFAKQSEGKIPTFIMWVNNTKFLHFSYERFLEKQLREYFGFEGTPIRLLFRNKKGRDYDTKK